MRFSFLKSERAFYFFCSITIHTIAGLAAGGFFPHLNPPDDSKTAIFVQLKPEKISEPELLQENEEIFSTQTMQRKTTDPDNKQQRAKKFKPNSPERKKHEKPPASSAAAKPESGPQTEADNPSQPGSVFNSKFKRFLPGIIPKPEGNRQDRSINTSRTNIGTTDSISKNLERIPDLRSFGSLLSERVSIPAEFKKIFPAASTEATVRFDEVRKLWKVTRVDGNPWMRALWYEILQQFFEKNSPFLDKHYNGLKQQTLFLKLTLRSHNQWGDAQRAPVHVNIEGRKLEIVYFTSSLDWKNGVSSESHNSGKAVINLTEKDGLWGKFFTDEAADWTETPAMKILRRSPAFLSEEPHSSEH